MIRHGKDTEVHWAEANGNPQLVYGGEKQKVCGCVLGSLHVSVHVGRAWAGRVLCFGKPPGCHPGVDHACKSEA